MKVYEEKYFCDACGKEVPTEQSLHQVRARDQICVCINCKKKWHKEVGIFYEKAREAERKWEEGLWANTDKCADEEECVK